MHRAGDPKLVKSVFLDQDRPAREFNINEIMTNGLSNYPNIPAMPNISNGMSVNGQNGNMQMRNRIENGRMGDVGMHNGGSPIPGQKIRHHGNGGYNTGGGNGYSNGGSSTSSSKGRVISYIPAGGDNNGLYSVSKRSPSNYSQGQPNHSTYSFMRRR